MRETKNPTVKLWCSEKKEDPGGKTICASERQKGYLRGKTRRNGQKRSIPPCSGVARRASFTFLIIERDRRSEG